MCEREGGGRGRGRERGRERGGERTRQKGRATCIREGERHIEGQRQKAKMTERERE